MPSLSCSALNCMYNDDRYCCKGDIMVTGDHAEEACETCCSSFRENGQSDAALKNSVGDASREVFVECTACNCRYNEDEECQAGSINISGHSACSCQDTECCTFDRTRI